MSNSLVSEGIRFSSYCRLPLAPGEYKVAVHQTVIELQTKKLQESELPVPFTRPDFEFAVAGPRFALNPADIYSVYPPEGSTGAFANSLPHIVFTRRTIPWERPIPSWPEGRPWMALLLLSAEDFNDEDGKFPKIEPRQVSDLLFDPDKLKKDGVAGPTISNLQPWEKDDPCNTIDMDAALFAKVAPGALDLDFLAHVREVNTDQKETASFLTDGSFSVVIGNRFPQPAQTDSKGVDLNLATLDQLKDELGKIGEAYAEKILAARQYLSKEDLERKETVEGVDLNKAAPDQLRKALGKIGEVYAQKIVDARPYVSKMDLEHRKIVPAAVFKEVSPAITVRQAVENRAILVSLEGMQDFLPPGKKTQDTPKKLRLAVLASWTFHCEDARDFASAMHDLGEELEPLRLKYETPKPEKDNSKAAPEDANVQYASETEKYVRGAFSRGYAALNHNTRLGEKTVSWYRGPLSPLEMAVSGRHKFKAVPDALVEYDHTRGLMDLTYAGAAQLGRLLGLQDRSFAQALCEWRTEVQRKIRARMQKEELRRILNSQRAGEHLLQSPESEFLESALSEAMEDKAGKKYDLEKFEDRIDKLKINEKDLPATVRKWLARRVLLYGVPFLYLVPDERMLPMPSMRFFRIDPLWVRRLLEGACSVGRNSTNAQLVDSMLADQLFDIAVNGSAKVRQRPDEGEGANNAGDGNAAELPRPEPVFPFEGFLLRSPIVRGWQGLEMKAWYKKKGETKQVPAPPLRIDRLGPDIMLCIFNGPLTEIEIRQPPEGMHFGADEKKKTILRRVKKPNPGKQIKLEISKVVKIPFRGVDQGDSDGLRVVNVPKLARRLYKGLKDHDGITHDPPLTSAEFAVQMTKSPGRAVIIVGDKR
jgi:DNA uptake protein ComE-like DNA-binding protein